MVVIWSERAQIDLKKAFDYIAGDSLQNAEKVRDKLIDMTLELSDNPEKYSLDKFKSANNGTWRAFEKYHYRVSYRILKDQIRIVRLRHTKRTPLNH